MIVAPFDTECYPNYWLLKIRPRGMPTFAFRLLEGEQFDDSTIRTIRALFGMFTVVSFNGRGYDISMITAALLRFTPAELKALNDRIIVENVKPWELGLPEWPEVDHIDVMEVAPGAGSLKQYGARIHSKRLRDLPYPPDQRLTPAEIADVESYCENDLDLLTDLYDALAPQILQREMLGKRYCIDLRSKSDAQLAETVLKRRCEAVIGRRLYKPEIDWNFAFYYRVPEYIGFTDPGLQHALNVIRTARFRLGANGAVEMPKELEALKIRIGLSTYKMGIGGLHSQEKRVAHVADATYVIRDNDVASYYPSLILNSGEFPAALGPTFLSEYEAIKTERLEAKKEQAKLKKKLALLEKELRDAEAETSVPQAT